MTSPYVTRSVTRRNDQVHLFVTSLFDKYSYGMYQLLKKDDVIDIIKTGMSCPDAVAYHPQLRDGMKLMVYAMSLNPYYGNDQDIIALREEFEMFMDSIKVRSDYKA